MRQILCLTDLVRHKLNHPYQRICRDLTARRNRFSHSMAFSSPHVPKFRAAVDDVYGPLPSNITDAVAWTPPAKSGGFKGRYLWTDAFGVVDFLTLHQATKDETYLILAKNLVTAVHDIQGRTRDGQSRLPGASDENPLGGGLRIGKTDESGPDADGQYHHYLTLWMFALNRLSIAAHEPLYNKQAIQLAKAIQPRFFVGKDTNFPRMVWKISVDMSRPLVHSQGNLDPIDGYVTMKILQASAREEDPSLDDEIHDYRRVMELKGKHFVSDDTLDLGMSAWASHWLADKEKWAEDLQSRSLKQLGKTLAGGARVPGRYRLAFRDFGACLGVGCCDAADSSLKMHADQLIRDWEAAFALTPDELRPITQVMYAAALIPGAFKKGWLSSEPDL
jgi:hypothetical protein